MHIYIIDFSMCIFLTNIRTLTLVDDSDLKQPMLVFYIVYQQNIYN